MKFFAIAALVSCATLISAMPTSITDEAALAARASDLESSNSTVSTSAPFDFSYEEDGELFDEDDDNELDVEHDQEVDNDDSAPESREIDEIDDVESEDDAAILDSRAAKCSSTPNAATISLIKSFEGFVKKPSPDPIGLPTVGFGHQCIKKGCAETKLKFPITQAQATTLLQKDVQKFVKCLNGALKKSVKLNANQFGALVSWSFNVGCGNMRSSTLLKKLNRGDNPNTAAAKELPRWKKSGGRTLAGLVRRRKAEVALFKKASSVVAHPC